MAGAILQKARPVSDLERIQVFYRAEFAESLPLNRVLFTTDARQRHPLPHLPDHLAAAFLASARQ
jgi:hypothetical protein